MYYAYIRNQNFDTNKIPVDLKKIMHIEGINSVDST